MTTRSPLLRIDDMLSNIEGVVQTLDGITYEEFTRSWALRSAVERGIEIVSEASRHLPADLKNQFPQIRWQDIAGIGNILRHDYQNVASKIIWQVAHNELPPLKTALLSMQASLSD